MTWPSFLWLISRLPANLGGGGMGRRASELLSSFPDARKWLQTDVELSQKLPIFAFGSAARASFLFSGGPRRNKLNFLGHKNHSLHMKLSHFEPFSDREGKTRAPANPLG